MVTREELLDMGLNKLETGNFSGALADFKKSVELEPGDYDSWLYAGICHNELGEYKESMAAFEKCIQIDDSLPYAYANLGIVYQRKRDVHEAARYFFKAVRIDPGDIASRLNLGIAYLRIRNKEFEALQEFKAVLHVDDSIPEAWHYLGMLFMEMMKKELALYCFEKAKLLGLSGGKNAKLIIDLKFDGVQPKNPFDPDVVEAAFNPLKR